MPYIIIYSYEWNNITFLNAIVVPFTKKKNKNKKNGEISNRFIVFGFVKFWNENF